MIKDKINLSVSWRIQYFRFQIPDSKNCPPTGGNCPTLDGTCPAPDGFQIQNLKFQNLSAYWRIHPSTGVTVSSSAGVIVSQSNYSL